MQAHARHPKKGGEGGGKGIDRERTTRSRGRWSLLRSAGEGASAIHKRSERKNLCVWEWTVLGCGVVGGWLAWPRVCPPPTLLPRHPGMCVACRGEWVRGGWVARKRYWPPLLPSPHRRRGHPDHHPTREWGPRSPRSTSGVPFLWQRAAGTFCVGPVGANGWMAVCPSSPHAPPLSPSARSARSQLVTHPPTQSPNTPTYTGGRRSSTPPS